MLRHILKFVIKNEKQSWMLTVKYFSLFIKIIIIKLVDSNDSTKQDHYFIISVVYLLKIFV